MSWINWRLCWNTSSLYTLYFTTLQIFAFFSQICKKFETSQNDVIHREMQRKNFVGISVNKILIPFCEKLVEHIKVKRVMLQSDMYTKLLTKISKFNFHWNVDCWNVMDQLKSFLKLKLLIYFIFYDFANFWIFFANLQKNLKLLKMM